MTGVTGRAAVSVRTAADMYDLSPDTVREAINRGELAAKKVGRTIRIDVGALREWFDGLKDAQERAS